MAGAPAMSEAGAAENDRLANSAACLFTANADAREQFCK